MAGGETTTVTKTKPETEINQPEQKDNAELSAKSADEAKNAGNASAELQKKFGVGLYDREVEVGQFLNIVA